MKKALCLTALLLAFTAGLFAQTAQNLETIVKSDVITYEQASYFPAIALELATEETSFEDCFKALQENGYISQKILPGDPVTLKDAAYLNALACNLKGSLMYSATKSSRYAFKLLQGKKIISMYADPMSKISGTELVNIYTECSDLNKETK